MSSGYFELFEKLLELFVQGGPAYSYLNPSIADKHGNTLLDVIGKYGTSCHTERAVDLLRRWTQTRGDDQPTMSPVQGDRLTMVSRATTLRKGIKTAQSKVVKARQSAADKPNASSSSKTVIIDFINRESEDWTKEDEPLALEKKRSYLDYKANSGNSIVSLPAHKIEKGNAEMVDNETNKPLNLETDFELDTRVFDHLAWEVECTADVWRTFQDRKWPYGLKKKAIDAIQRLREGEWTDSLSKRVHSPIGSGEWKSPIERDKRASACGKLVSVPTSRPSKRDNTSYRLPQSFTEATEEECAEVVLSPAANPDDNEYNVLKFYDFSSDVVRRILQQTNENIDFPFKVTAVEQNIISVRPESALLLAGRSGTGKTTCCLYRLWHSYKAYWSQALCEEPLIPRGNPAEASGCGSSLKPAVNYRVDMKNSASSSGLAKQASHHETLGHLQQLFVTKNGILLSEVHKKFNELRNGCDLNSLYSRPDSLLSNKLQDIPSHKYPLFVTSRKLLLMLDASLPGETFFERSENGTSAADDMCMSGAESSSPCLLEARPSGNATSLGKISKRLVTYDVFVVELWPKIRAKSKFQPSLVWTEIFTFIKGSFQSLLSQKGYLTSAQYQEVGRKCAPNFTGNRGEIYKIFRDYETERKRNGLFDECDLILNLHRRLDKNVLGWKVDEMYVDETQDFTQAELSLLIRLCENPNNMFLSGDTAQAIMQGISFRFADLKSLFYHTHDAFPSNRVTIPKQVFQLTDNYRSHQGILSLASSIVDLMVDFFPESVDLLDRDQGVFPGPSPILLEFCSSKDLAVLLKDSQRLTSAIEFGAHQAIVVLNEAARSSIPEELRAGLVLTIEESKGLEFDDILLYNFFKDSDANDEWRIVTSYLHRLATARDEPQAAGPSTPAPVEIDQEAIQTSACRPLAFNPMKHRVLCSEFKRLYTAITRARVNLWIYDEDEKSRASVFDYFKARCLVRTITSAEDSERETFAQMSSSADWTWRGDKFMERHSYDMAIKCYQKAGDRAREHVAMAHAASRRARGLQANPSKMREEFLTAAKLYLVNCGMVVEAAKCLVNAHETLLAARLYGKVGRMEKAGELYKLCDHHYYESWQFESQGLYNMAVQTLCDINSFDIAIDVVERYDSKVKEYASKGHRIPQIILENKPAYSREELTQKAGRINLKDKNCQSACAKQDVNRLLEQGLIPEAVKSLIESGDYHYAARVLMANGEFDEAVDISRLAGDSDLVRHCRWASCKNKIFQFELTNTPVMDDGTVAETLSLLLAYLNNVKDFTEACEAQLLLGQISQDVDVIENARRMFGSLGSESNEAGQVECSKAKLKLSSLRHNGKACYRFASQDLACLLKALRVSHNPDGDAEEEKVKMYLRYYGLEDDEDGMVMYHPKHSPKCQIFLDRHSQKFTVRISIYRAAERFQRYLLNLAYDWVTVIRSTVQSVQSFSSQCPAFTEGRLCNRVHSCKHLHEPYTKETFLECFYSLLTLVHINVIVRKAYHYMKDDDIKEELGQLLSLENSTSFSNLICFVLKSGMHWELFSRDTHLVDIVFNNLCQADLREGLSLWQSWFVEDGIRLTSGLTSRLTEQSLFGLVTLSKTNLSMGSVAFPSFPTTATKQENKETLMNNFNIFCEAVRKFYHPGSDTLESLAAYEKFLTSLDDPTDIQHTEQLLFFMEFNLMVIFHLGAKHAKLAFIVPSRYISVVRFVDKWFAKKKSLRYIVAFSKVGDINIALSSTVHSLTNILLGKRQGGGKKSPGLLRQTFMASDIDACAAERCWVMSLTLLSNMSLLKPKTCEEDLLSAVHEVCTRLPQIKWKHRLVSALERTFRCCGQRDIVEELAMILKGQNEEELLVCRWQDGSRSIKEGLHMEAIAEVHLTAMPEKFDTDEWLGRVDMVLQMDRKAVKSCVSREFMNQQCVCSGFTNQQCVSREFMNRQCVSSEFMNRQCVSREFMNQQCVSREFMNQQCVSREFMNQQCVSSGFTNQQCVSRELMNQQCVSSGFTNQQCVSREFMNQQCTQLTTDDEGGYQKRSNKIYRISTGANMTYQSFAKTDI
ncbi:TPR and ankyrin repeat-containing protein 1-like [Liolophura sinensis]|uniref:TPR and ankyrin repeat-containing protein 1-like n=1 Tax=Liolophura sinensis TaxID=3198878 RepID=UPI00315992E4